MPRKTFKFDPQTYAVVPNMHFVHLMKGAPLSVYIILCKMMNEDYESWPSISTLSAITGYSERQVGEGLKKLEKLGILRKAPQFRKDGSQTSNRYEIRVVVEEGGVQSTAGGRVQSTAPHEQNHIEQKSFRQSAEGADSTPPTNLEAPRETLPAASAEGGPPPSSAFPPTIFKLYMDVVVKYRLPKPRNFNEVKAKARSLEQESEGDSARVYLQALLQIDYNALGNDDEYKPQLLNAVDIYTKRRAILLFMQKHVEPEAPRRLGPAQEVDWSDM